jgi:glycerol-3-phosphate dehydrogenase
MPEKTYDVAIIGAGVVGCSVARELSRFKLSIAVVEKESDVAEGASGANSGVIHTGFKEPKLSLKALYCSEGNRRFPEIARELDVPYKKVGTYTVGETIEDLKKLEKLKEAGEAAGAIGLRILEEKELKQREPHVKGNFALLAPEGGITDPHEYTIALAENAAQNGVIFYFNNEVKKIKRKDGLYTLDSGKTKIKAKIVVNSAGVQAGKIAELAGNRKHAVNACRGEYLVLDKKTSNLITGMIYPMPPEKTGGIGVHLTPTIGGNIIIGPTAEYINCLEDTSTTAERISELVDGARFLVPEINPKHVIHEYSGLRAKTVKAGEANKGDFIIEENPGMFIQLIGIESPGLTAAPVIADKVREIVGRHLKLEPNKKFNPKRNKRLKFSQLSDAEKEELIKKNPDYGIVVCRCEQVTKGEIIESLRNPLGVGTLKGIRIRTRAGMGRCQGSFCMPKIMEIFRELNIKELTLKGCESSICVRDLR